MSIEILAATVLVNLVLGAIHWRIESARRAHMPRMVPAREWTKRYPHP